MSKFTLKFATSSTTENISLSSFVLSDLSFIMLPYHSLNVFPFKLRSDLQRSILEEDIDVKVNEIKMTCLFLVLKEVRPKC